MVFLAPLWLLALIPWAGLVVWLLSRRGGTVEVPFVLLWRGESAPRRQRGQRLPPLTIVLLLAAILLALLATAEPAWRTTGQVTVLLDRGAAMSVDLRYKSAASEVSAQLSKMGLSARLIAVPAVEHPIHSIDDIPPTAVDTRPLLAATLADELARQPGVVVVTDQNLPLVDDRRAFRVAPRPPVPQVTITLMTARTYTPANGSTTAPAGVAQVMIRLRNDTELSHIALEVESAGETQQLRVDLPPTGQSRNYFVDFPSLGPTLHARVGGGLGQQAWLAKQPGRPVIEARGAVGPAIERIIAAYSKARPASPGSASILVSASALPNTVSGIVTGTGNPAAIQSPPVVVDDPRTRSINWPAICKGAMVAGNPPTGWKPLVTAGRTVMAVDPTGRQIWIGLQPSTNEQSVDWVILWTHLFDQLGATDRAQFAAAVPQLLDGDWEPITANQPAGTEVGFWPGLYRHKDGRTRAINAPAIPPQTAATSPDWPAHVFKRMTAASSANAGGPRLSQWLILAALALLVMTLWQAGRGR